MLVPRFSIRTLLVMLTLGAVACLVAGMAFRGQAWALGATVALAALVITGLIHAGLFGVLWIFAQLTRGRSTSSSDRRPTP